MNNESKVFIPVSQPYIGIEEEENIKQAMKEKAISGFFGEFLIKFEEKFAGYIGTKYAISCSSGTTAIHLALASLSFKQGDEILIASLTNMATFFPALILGLKPIPVDIEPDTLNINPALIEKLVTAKTRAIIVVHLFGHPVDMDPILEVAKKYSLVVIEDCAQAHGATYKNKKVGSIGDIGCFSFYANKIITTGEGGMITTNKEEIYLKAKSLKSLAFGAKNKFMHSDIGYNFRMTNIQAAIGCAQLEKIHYIIERKRANAQYYTDQFKYVRSLQLPVEKSYAHNVYWMYHVALQGEYFRMRPEVMEQLKQLGIETREGFVPYNMQEFALSKGWVNGEECPRANDYASRCFYLPSSPSLSSEELEYVAKSLKSIVNG